METVSEMGSRPTQRVLIGRLSGATLAVAAVAGFVTSHWVGAVVLSIGAMVFLVWAEWVRRSP